MQHFDSDYMEGAHPRILQRLLETNMEKLPGYGLDKYCESAKEKIKAACACPEAEVYLLTGGTQTNSVVIDALLGPCEGVIAANTGHISVHEAGAIEACGHKVIELEGENGKLKAQALKSYLETFEADGTKEHMVAPALVYISHPTEYGTLYCAKELKELSALCHEHGILLYLDGARLGYGLMASGTYVNLELIAECCDAFYIGGTKVGALCGEAVVFPKKGLVKRFFSLTKQHGALLAKGWLLGIQFDTLFSDNLYFDISRHAIEMAEKMKRGFISKGYTLYLDSPTNQQFVVLENSKLEELAEHVTFSVWEHLGEQHTVVRFATSWATTEEDVDELIARL